MNLYVVATPIGNLSDLSQRAIEVLSNCRLIAAEDTRHTIKLLNHFGIKTPLTSYHKFNEKSKAEAIISRMISEDIDVALVSDAGTPCVSDPGHEIVAKARESGIPVFAVAGPCAISAAISACGYEAGSFAFFGFLPREKKLLASMLDEMKLAPVDLLVIYESPRRVIKTAEVLASDFPEAEFCFCCELTKLHEKYFRGKADEVLAALASDPYSETGEYCIVIKKGKVAIALKPAETELAPEALIVQAMIAQGLDLREACEFLQGAHVLTRNQAYKASLSLKQMME